MMNMADRIFAVDDIPLQDLEAHLNEMAQDNWVLHSINQGDGSSSLPYFIVIAHRPYDWEDAAKRHKERWALTMGTTGGHANE